jgi:hypothetical protein
MYVTANSTLRDANDHIADLRAALEAERRARGETRRLLAAALERIPALLPPETSEDHVQDAAPVQEGTTARPHASAILSPQSGPGGAGSSGVRSKSA